MAIPVDVVRVRITAQSVRNALIADAKRSYSSAQLAGIDKLTEFDIRERHNRHHTLYISPRIEKLAKCGSATDCAFALSAKAQGGIFAAFILQRVAYTLEKDEVGKWAMYKFGTPDMARKRIIAFDKGKGMKEHSVTFSPLPLSRTSFAPPPAVPGKKRGKRKTKPRQNTKSLMRMTMPEDLALAA